jgi:hypothetical protein
MKGANEKVDAFNQAQVEINNLISVGYLFCPQFGLVELQDSDSSIFVRIHIWLASSLFE